MTALLVSLVTLVDAPTLPPRCRPELYQMHHRIGVAAANGDWNTVEQELKKWPVGTIRYSLPEGDKVQIAAREAERILEALSDGEWKFVQSDDPQIRFEWTEQVDPSKSRVWQDGVLVTRLPLKLESGEALVSERSYTAAIAKSFAMYAGLDESNVRFSLMGPDIYVASSPSMPPIGASHEEKALIRKILDARKTWEQILRDRTPVRYVEPRLVVTPKDIDLGTIERGPDLKAPFTLRNEGDAEVLMEFESSCQCILAETPPSIPARTEKTIDAVVQSRDMLGKITKWVTLYTNDPVEPVKRLSVSLLAVPTVRVVPDTMTHLTLKDEGATSFEFVFYATSPKPVRLTRVDLNMEGVKSRIEPFNGTVRDPLFDNQPILRLGYKVTLTFEENYPSGLNWLRVIFLTDLATMPYIDVTIETHKGILAVPKTIWFGIASVGTPVVRTVTLQHGETPFEIEKIEAPDGVEVTAAPSEDRRSWKLDASWTPRATGMLNGEIVVYTNSKRFPRISIPFSGKAQ